MNPVPLLPSSTSQAFSVPRGGGLPWTVALPRLNSKGGIIAKDSCPRVAVRLPHLCNTGGEGVGICACGPLDWRKGFLPYEVSPALRAPGNATRLERSVRRAEAPVAGERQHSMPGMHVGQRKPRKQKPLSALGVHHGSGGVKG
ncbi:hypothetical protein NDU88_005667 [Pleurodeles waltl]|uniref:Uncharacterized protein n=1 Tax=Pleurodeles waltl TaxID=8319 RepID=A0AAV7NS38_PLEWA|nr:hypothetical protein NDU88_005667 [Pleurodeles waltl]